MYGVKHGEFYLDDGLKKGFCFKVLEELWQW
jgi:hypothetical protein